MIIARLTADNRPDLLFDDAEGFSCTDDPGEALYAANCMAMRIGPPSQPNSLRDLLEGVAEATVRKLVDIAIPNESDSPFTNRIY